MTRVVAVVLAALVLVGCGGDDGGDGDAAEPSGSTTETSTATTAPSAGSTTDAQPERRPLAGFGQTAFRILREGHTFGEWCALLADDGVSRAQGLMEQQDLRGYDGMLFAFEAPTTSSFYMRNTPLPLSIAFFDAGGDLVSTADMEPCEDRDGCPLYSAAGSYVHALEVEQGDLPDLGVEDGAVLEVGGACPPLGGSS